MDSDLIIVIPARGGSKGIPRKNLAEVGGKALIARAVETAVQAEVGEVIVSTDDHAIADGAMRSGASWVRYRPESLATDEASSEAVLLDALDWVALHRRWLVLMQCTSPFTNAEDVRRVAERLRAGAECVVTVTPFYGFLWSVDYQCGRATPVAATDSASQRKRRQERVPPYLETGALYGMRTDLFVKTGSRFCGEVSVVMMPKYRAREIDDRWDLTMCQRMANWPGGAG